MTVNIGLGRSYGRGPEEKRPTKITRHFLDNVPGSCLIETGATKVLCAVSIEERVKAWRKGARCPLDNRRVRNASGINCQAHVARAPYA